MARLNTKKLLGVLISFTLMKDRMLITLRKNPSIPGREKKRDHPSAELFLYFLQELKRLVMHLQLTTSYFKVFLQCSIKDLK